jgi:hypothetical protein
MPRKAQCQLHKRIQCIFCHRPKKKPSKKRAEMVDSQDKCPEEGCTKVLLQSLYAGFTTGHLSHLFVSTPHTAGVVEGNLKIFLAVNLTMSH